MKSDSQKYQEALQGLETATKILYCYTASEAAFLHDNDPAKRQKYAEVLLPSYTALLKYQCVAAQYFGQQTLKQLVKNTTGPLRGLMTQKRSLLSTITAGAPLDSGELHISKIS